MGCAASSSVDVQQMLAKMSEGNTQIVTNGPGEDFKVIKGAVPDCPASGVLIKTSCTGLCHSDVHIWQSKIKITDDVIVPVEMMSPAFKWPVILGHEISGRVVSLGNEKVPGAGALKVGDRVVVFSWIGCRSCGWCEQGMNNFCKESFNHDIGVVTPGGYQSYMAIPDKRYVLPIPDAIPDDVACMFGCSAITAYNACLKLKTSVERAEKAAGESKILISGAGGLGFWCIQVVKAMYPHAKIFVASAGAAKLEEALKLGAHETIEWPRDGNDEKLIEKTKAATLGIDAAIDTVSIPATLGRILQCTNKGATIVAPGMSGGTFPVPLVMLTLRDVTLTGVYTGNPEQIKEFMQFYVKHKLKPPPVEHITPEQVDETMKKLHEGKLLGRAVIKF